MTLMKKTGTDIKKPNHIKDGELGENTTANINNVTVATTLREEKMIDKKVLVVIIPFIY